MHELAHIQRMDWPAQILARLACAMYWFNPLVWFACRNMRMECEQSCDNAVLQAGHTGTEYAGHLLDIVKAMCVKRHTAMVTIPMARVSTVEGRIRAILDGTRQRWSLTRWAAIGVAIITVCVLIPFAALQATARTKRTEHKTVTVTDEGTNTTVVVTNIVISTTITPAEIPLMTNEVIIVEEEAETKTLSFAVSGRINKVKPPGTVVTNGEILAQLDSGNNWLAVEATRIGAAQAAEEFSRTKEKNTAVKNMLKEDLITAEEMNESEEEYLIAKADLSKAQFALSKADLNLEACFLRAPADGTIEKVYKQPGTIIQPAAPVLQFSNRSTKGVQITKEHDQHSAAGVKTVTKHIERSQVGAQPVLSNFVRLVVGPDTMTFEGKDIAWEALPEALKKITGRQNTVIEFAQPDNANPDMIAFGKLINLAQNFNFNHVSDIGEKPLGSKGTVRYTGSFETGRIIPVTLAGSTAKAEGIVTTRAITFTTGENGTIKAVVDYNLLSGPKSRWWIMLSLLDEKGNEVAYDRISIENSGIIKGLPFSESKKAIFYFRGTDKTEKITQFRISISQGFVLQQTVMIAAQLIVHSEGKENVISQPSLVALTGKEAEISVGAQEPVPSGKLVDTGIKITFLPSIERGVLVVHGKAKFSELTGTSSKSKNKTAPLKWHSVKDNTTEFDLRVKDQSKQYTIGPIPYKENETLIIKLNAKILKSKNSSGSSQQNSQQRLLLDGI